MSPFLDFPALKIIQTLARDKKRKVYLVGGCLRDQLLGRPQTDFDFAVDRGALTLARTFAQTIKGAFVLLDEDAGCARVVKKQNGKMFTFDFADFRASTLAKDIAGRDFTINTLCLPLKDWTDQTSVAENLLDFTHAHRDLKAKVIRMVAPRAFQDDPLRIMRAYSLRAQLGFRIEAKTLARIKKEKTLIGHVSAERVREELFKILASPRTHAVIQDMDRIGLLVCIIPQVTVMYKVHQGGYHHLDVWRHTLEALKQLDKIIEDAQSNAAWVEYLNAPIGGGHPRYALIKLAILLHDIGKPDTKRQENGRMSFHTHEHVGKRIARVVAKNLKLSVKERYAIEDMVLFHLRPGYLSNFKKPSEKSIFRYFRDTRDEAAGILFLSLADQRATRGPMTSDKDQMHHDKICRGLIDRFFVMKQHVPLVRLINGNDLIKILKLKPSPLFAKILKNVEEQQALGKIRNKKEALDVARGMAA